MEFWRSEDYLLEGASGGSGDQFILLPFCGTAELRDSCLQWQGEGPDPWMELRRVQHEFLEGKLRALIQKVESHCACNPPILLPFCGTEELRDTCLQWQGEGPDPWKELRRVQHEFLEGKLRAFIEKLSSPRRHGGRVLVPVMEAAPAHRLDSTKPDVPGPVAQALCDSDHVEDNGREKMLEPPPKIQCQEAPAPELTTTSHPQPSSQGDTAPSLTTNTKSRSLKLLATNLKTSIVCRSRSSRRVLVQVLEAEPTHRLDLQGTKPELEPVPAAQDEDDLEVLEVEDHRPGCDERRETAPKRKTGWLQHLLSCFRWTARKS
ncbi:uncharacterized protein LOC111193387 isoform X1 [Astyanax mexicanus]|uniref:uncharacterized protein LOC111193387 isoform X1 n=1 Tax=Astyanax mexicanus TaxID=7994 RepID=UPI0020CB19AB|nr:uncharacterized protein LOC111193387 isoform X1 [Astyanax mexicanus]